MVVQCVRAAAPPFMVGTILENMTAGADGDGGCKEVHILDSPALNCVCIFKNCGLVRKW